MSNAISIIQNSSHFVIPSIKTARASAIGELSANSEKPVKLTAAQEEVIEKAVKCQQQSVDAMLSYWDLCMALRKHKMDSGESRTLLFAAGFPKSRVSEIQTIIYSSASVFEAYANRAIGFRLALATARGEKSKQTLLSIPHEMEEQIAPLIQKLLGDKRKAVVEFNGMVIKISRAKPAVAVKSDVSKKASVKKGGK